MEFWRPGVRLGLRPPPSVLPPPTNQSEAEQYRPLQEGDHRCQEGNQQVFPQTPRKLQLADDSEDEIRETHHG